VEQENFVKVGQKDFSSKELQFVESLNLCNFRGEFIAIALGVFQYLKDPNEYLVRIVELEPKYILIDATPFSPNGEESISIQIVPSSIYPSSYAAHVFSWKNLIGALLNEYFLVCDWDCVEQPDPRNVYRGGIFERKEQF
jgi:putative methyltransferase (TIGR04325 family)